MLIPTNIYNENQCQKICDGTNFQKYLEQIKLQISGNNFFKSGYTPCLLNESRNITATQNSYKSRIEQWNNIGMNRNLLKKIGFIEFTNSAESNCFKGEDNITFFTHKSIFFVCL